MAINMTWRAHRRLKRLGLFLGVTVSVSVAVWLCWVIWLGRFVVYSREEARLDFDWVPSGEAVEALPPEKATVTIHYNEGDELIVEKNTELTRISGFYVTAAMLRQDTKEVDTLVRQQEKGSAILIDLKNGLGSFYYPTTITDAPISSQVDMDTVDELIQYLSKADYYTIARIPAFRDRAYGLENTQYGLHHTSGMYLWYDADNCYWLDPTRNGTRNYLVTIATELRDLGFDEVVFTDFCFPDTEDILFEGSRTDALNDTAQYLVENLATEEFCVSFETNDPQFLLPQGRSRLYLQGIEAGDAQNTAAGLKIDSMEINLVYLTEAKDTRFDVFSVLRPLPVSVRALEQPTEATEPSEAAEPGQSGDETPPEEQPEPENGEAG